VNFEKQGVNVRDLTLGLHDFPSQLWLTLLVDPNDFSVTGPIGGKVVVNGNPTAPGGLTPEGKLTLANGNVQFNFLRAPIVVQGATLTMHRKQVILDMPGSKLQNQAINFRVSVADYTHPSIRIDATVQKLDLEVMKLCECRGRRRRRRLIFQFHASATSNRAPPTFPLFR
jgi:hypothetical protein